MRKRITAHRHTALQERGRRISLKKSMPKAANISFLRNYVRTQESPKEGLILVHVSTNRKNVLWAMNPDRADLVRST